MTSVFSPQNFLWYCHLEIQWLDIPPLCVASQNWCLTNSREAFYHGAKLSPACCHLCYPIYNCFWPKNPKNLGTLLFMGLTVLFVSMFIFLLNTESLVSLRLALNLKSFYFTSWVLGGITGKNHHTWGSGYLHFSPHSCNLRTLEQLV